MIELTWNELSSKILDSKVFLIPTDTIYGFSTLARSKEGIEKIKNIKEREKDKPFINLISSIEDLKSFNITLKNNKKEILNKLWPGPVTIILENDEKETIAFRIPDKKELFEFIKKVGPIVSTSANYSREPNIKEPKLLKKEMQDQTDFFIDEGELNSEPSTIMRILR